jgi:hypothetical protein
LGLSLANPLRAMTARGWLLHKSRECISRPVSRTNQPTPVRPSGGLGLPIDRRENMQSLPLVVVGEARPPQFFLSREMQWRRGLFPGERVLKPWLRVITSPYPRNNNCNGKHNPKSVGAVAVVVCDFGRNPSLTDFSSSV